MRNDAPEWVHVWFWMRFGRSFRDERALPQQNPFDWERSLSEEEATAVLVAWKAAGSPKVGIAQIVRAMSGEEMDR